MTVKEAKTKWCPQSICLMQVKNLNGDVLNIAGVNRGSFDKTKDAPDHCQCVGRACMWWHKNILFPNTRGRCGIPK